MVNLEHLPEDVLEKIFSYITYDEVSRCRLVCQRFNNVAKKILNIGFRKVEKYHALCLQKVKLQLPRRESERRKHPLARHCDILTAVETRLSLLGMTFTKYIDLNFCCFIPGKVLDEIYRVLRYVSTEQTPVRAHEVLQELRDLSSMAMEYFDEKIAPALKTKTMAAMSPHVPRMRIFVPQQILFPSPQYILFTSFLQSQASNMAACLDTRHALKTGSSHSAYSNKIHKVYGMVRHITMKYGQANKEITNLNQKLSELKNKNMELEKKIAEQQKLMKSQMEKIKEHDHRLNVISQQVMGCEIIITPVCNISHFIADQNEKKACSNSEQSTVEHISCSQKRKLRPRPSITTDSNESPSKKIKK